MKDVRDFNNPTDACDTLKNDVLKLLGFIKANLPENKDWPTAEEFGHIREQLLYIAQFITNSETTEEVTNLVNAFKK